MSKIKDKKTKLNEEIKYLKRGRKSKDRKLSKHEENQSLLLAVKERREEKQDNEIQEKTLSRTFMCNCGCEVRLSGNIDLSMTQCSVCQKGGYVPITVL